MTHTSWTFTDLDEYHDYLRTHNELESFPFNASYFDLNRSYFSKIGIFFRDYIPKYPPTTGNSKIESVLGEHTKRSLLLSSENLYSRPVEFVRQGDVFRSDTDFPTEASGLMTSFWIVLSQTCVVEQEAFSVIIPGYRYEELIKDESLSLLGVRPPNPRAGIFQNKKARLLSLPPSELQGMTDEEDDDFIVFDLAQKYTIPSDLLKKKQVQFSLTFPANAYFMNRVTYFLLRDLAKNDDQRSTLS